LERVAGQFAKSWTGCGAEGQFERPDGRTNHGMSEYIDEEGSGGELAEFLFGNLIWFAD
jgi:hypothetical protein